MDRPPEAYLHVGIVHFMLFPDVQGGDGPVLESVQSLAAVGDARHPADVNDFTFDSFEAQYVLGRDDDGHSTLTTTETIVARFPEFDQNRGIRRAIPATYQGHTTSLEVVSVTDESGDPRPYSVDADSGIVTVTSAVPEGSFVRGVQTYVITYTQRDVVDYFTNTTAEEFYWNINGTDWRQPFGVVRGTLLLEDGLCPGCGHLDAHAGGLDSG